MKEELKVINANDLKAKDVVLQAILKSEPSHTNGQINKWLSFSLGTDLFGAWLTYDDGEVVGVLTAEVVGNNAAYVAFDWAKAGVSKEGMLNKVEQWAQKLGLKRLIKYTNKSPTTYIKKFGWSVFQTVITKEL